MKNSHEQVIEIRPTSGWRALDLAEVWDHRELAFFLAMRDVRVRYKQTLLGATWAILQPLLTMLLFTAVFGRVARVQTPGVSYALFAFAGLVPWTYFSQTLGQGSQSLVGGAELLRKVYFPRVLIPLASVLAGLVDISIALGLLLVLAIVMGDGLYLSLLTVPLLMLALVVVTLGCTVWTSALNVRYRDVRHALPFITQLLLFATPIAYPATSLPAAWQWVAAVNPLSPVIEGFRWAFIGEFFVDARTIPLSVITGLLTTASGLLYFRRVERSFADIV